MKFTRAEITARSDAKKREEGFVRLTRWIPNTPEAIAEFEKQIERINKRFNCIKFK
jgi:hypothetical protein